MEDILDSVETLLTDFNLNDESVKDRVFKLIEQAYSNGYEDGCKWMKNVVDKLIK